MHLKRLEISGFKSFAHKTIMDFDRGITAIVGPNGCGKSNIVDSIKWVLGEQSMKSVRGKRGEDLIFSGAKKKVRLGKARVALLMDNSARILPIDFPEVSISRHIFRNGENEYLINDSQVRLKDVVEVLAKARMVQKSFSIINQGMTDAILNYSSQERRLILEEAAGVREYQIKKDEALRKIKNTQGNLEKAASLMMEIAPHLRYLKKQAIRAEKGEEIQGKLLGIQKRYFGAILKNLYKEEEAAAKRIKSIRDDIFQKSGELIKLKKELNKEEKNIFGEGNATLELQQKWNNLRLKIGDLEKNLAKIEAKIELSQSSSVSRILPVDVDYIKTRINQAIEIFKKVLGFQDGNDKEKLMNRGLGLLVNLYSEINEEKIQKYVKKSEPAPALLAESIGLEKQIAGLSGEADEIQAELVNVHNQESKEKRRLFELERNIRNIEDDISRRKDTLRDLEVDEAKISMRVEEIEREVNDSGITTEEISDYNAAESGELRKEEAEKEIRRLKLQLDEIGSIDSATIQEYKETNQRYGFLEKESQDLKDSIAGLDSVIKDLEAKIQTTFNDYFSVINDEFNNYFRLIFGGGRASLLRKTVSRPQKEENISDTENSEEDKNEFIQEGIDISATLPGKKIKDLSLFSGGERSLTSIAMLFSIIASSAPPFLVLDEIDAALDEDNSQKFGKILRELSQKTQFILITHNRETMKLASTLYGVTMDDGVSRILSLKLTPLEV